MKRKYLLATLIIFPLVACNSIKAPKFSGYHNKVSYSEFLNSLNVSNLNDFLTFTNSMSGKSYVGYKVNSSSKLENTTLFENDYLAELNYSFKIDSLNQRSTLTIKGEGNGEGQGAERKEQEVSKVSTTRQFQFATINGKEKLINIDKAQQVYYLASYNDYGEIVAAPSLSYLSTGLFYISSFKSFPQPTQDSCSFYVDGNLFTLVIDASDEGNILADEVNVGKFTKNVDLVFQIELSESKLQCRYSETNTNTYEYTDFYSTHLKGEIQVDENITYSTAEIKLGDNTIKEIDVSKYAFRDQDLENPES